jgi:hypothetical protein
MNETECWVSDTASHRSIEPQDRKPENDTRGDCMCRATAIGLRFPPFASSRNGTEHSKNCKKKKNEKEKTGKKHTKKQDDGKVLFSKLKNRSGGQHSLLFSETALSPRRHSQVPSYNVDGKIPIVGEKSV